MGCNRLNCDSGGKRTHRKQTCHLNARKTPRPKQSSILSGVSRYLSFIFLLKIPPLSFLVARPSKDTHVFDLKLFAKLDAFCLNICDEKKNIADIKIQGIKFFVTSNSSSSFVSKQLLIIALKDI